MKGILYSIGTFRWAPTAMGSNSLDRFAIIVRPAGWLENYESSELEIFLGIWAPFNLLTSFDTYNFYPFSVSFYNGYRYNCTTSNLTSTDSACDIHAFIRMGGSISSAGQAIATTSCEDGTPVNSDTNATPPTMRRVLTIEERMWEKVGYISIADEITTLNS